MKKRIFILFMAILCISVNASITSKIKKSLTSIPKGYEIGDIVDDFSWEHSNGEDPRDTISLSELITAKKAVVLEFSQCWCGPCNAAAPHLEKIWKEYGGISNKKLYICAALTQNIDGSLLTWDELDGSAWREKYNLTHWLAITDLYNHGEEFNLEGFPHMAIIGKDRKLMWYGSPFDDNFEKELSKAAHENQNLKPNFENEIADQVIVFGNDVTIDLSNTFITEDNSEWTLEAAEYSEENIVNADISGKTLTLSAQKIGISDIKIKAISGEEEAHIKFRVTTEDPNTLWAQWGNNYNLESSVGDEAGDWEFAVDFDFKENQVDVSSFAIGMDLEESNLDWKIVKVINGKISNEIIGDLQGKFNSLGETETLVSIDSQTKLTGHIALVIRSSKNYCAMDPDAVCNHTWVRTQGSDWELLSNIDPKYTGVWHLKLGVNKLPGDYDPPTLQTISETVVVIGEDMEIEIGLLDYTGISSVKGIININGEESQIDFVSSGKKEFLRKDGIRNLYTFKGMIPAQNEVIKGTIKFDMTDSSEEANNAISSEYEIEWEPITDWVFNESFEGSFPPAGWKIVDVDGDGRNWKMVESPYQVHSGTKSVASASYDYNNVEALTPDNWLILPHIKGASKIRYWVSAQDPDYAAERYGIFVSETGTNPADFTEVFSEIMIAKDGGKWYKRTIDLSDYSEKEIYVAIRHWDCTDQFAIILDEVKIDGALGIESQEINKSCVLYQNYPNPFNPTTTIKFNLVNDGNVKLKIFNMAGEQVNNLISKKLTAGIHSIKFDGSKLNSGTYFYKLETTSGSIVKKMLLIK